MFLEIFLPGDFFGLKSCGVVAERGPSVVIGNPVPGVCVCGCVLRVVVAAETCRIVAVGNDAAVDGDGFAHLTVVRADQTAHVIQTVDMTCRIGVGDCSAVFTHQTAGGIVAGVADVGCRIAVGDGAGFILADQAACAYRCGCDTASGEAAFHASRLEQTCESAGENGAVDVGIDYAEILNGGAVDNAEQSGRLIFGRLGYGEILYRVAFAIERAGKGRGAVACRRCDG